MKKGKLQAPIMEENEMRQDEQAQWLKERADQYDEDMERFDDE